METKKIQNANICVKSIYAYISTTAKDKTVDPWVGFEYLFYNVYLKSSVSVKFDKYIYKTMIILTNI